MEESAMGDRSGKLNILVISDKPDFQTGLEDAAKGSHLNLIFAATVEDARGKMVGNDVRLVLLLMCLDGRDTLWFAQELKRITKWSVIALYPEETFKDQFAKEVFASWPLEPLRVFAELKQLLGLY